MRSIKDKSSWRRWLLPLAAAWLACGLAHSAAAEDLEPVLPLDPKFSIGPLKDDVLWDPAFRAQKPQAKSPVRALRSRSGRLEKVAEKRGAKTPPKLLRKLLELNVNLLNVTTDDDLAGKRSRAKGRVDRDMVNRKILDIAQQYASSIKAPDEKARAAYHEQLAKYYVKHLYVNMKALLTNAKAMPTELAPRAELLYALYYFDNGAESDRLSAIGLLSPKVDAMPPELQVVAYLTMARVMANIDPDGNALKEADPSYRTYLTKGMKLAARWPKPKKSMVLQYGIRLWRTAEPNGAWDQAPFELNDYGDMPETKAVLERRGLAALAAGNLEQGKQIYTTLTKFFPKNAALAKFDARIIEIERQQYVATRNPLALQKALLAMIKKYEEPTVLGDDKDQAGKLKKKFIALYRQLVTTEVNAALAENATPPARVQAIGLINSFEPYAADAKERESLRYNAGSLHILNGNYRASLPIFYKLALDKDTDPANRTKYFYFAVESQRNITAWPDSNSFGLLASEPAPTHTPRNLRLLLKLYEKYLASANDDAKGKEKNKIDWNTIAQIGVLQIKTGQAPKAVAQWQEALKADSKGTDAGQAAGFMLDYFEQKAAYDELETLVRFVLAKKMEPIQKGYFVNTQIYLGIALFKGGKEDIKAKRYAKAAKRFDEYVEKFAAMANHDQAMLLLAIAYRGMGEHVKGLAALRALAKVHPESPLTQKAMLDAGELAIGLALEDAAIAVYAEYLNRYANTPQAEKARITLADLYLGRGLYNKASALLQAMLKSGHLTRDRLDEVGAELLRVETLYGDQASAIRAAELFRQASPGNSEAMADLLVLQARMLNERGNLKKLKQIEAALAKMDRSEPTVTEALGEVRFMMAEQRGGNLVVNFQSIALHNPSKTVAKLYTVFDKTKGLYDQVCQAGETSFCAPALYKIWRISNQFIESYSEIKLPDTLSEKEVNAFNRQKGKLIASITKTREQAKNQAREEIAKGATDPTWVREVFSQDPEQNAFSWLAYDSTKFYLQFKKNPERDIAGDSSDEEDEEDETPPADLSAEL